MQNLPTLRQLQYLLALAEHRNFNKAAEACYVTQSTLSGALREMETILRADVVDRSSRKGVRFTPLGEDILKSARGIIAKMEEITYRAQAQTEALSWPLRLGIIPTIAPYMLPPLLKPLQKALPKLELHIHELRSPQVVEKIHDGSIDFAFMAFPFDLKGLYEKPVLREKFLIAGPPDSFKNKRNLSMQDIENEKLLLLEDGHCLRDHALDACKMQSMTEMKTLSAASMSTLIQLVHQGYGITFLPEMAAKGTMLPKDLVLREIKGPAPPSRMVGFSWKQGSLRERDIIIVTDILCKLINNKPLPGPKRQESGKKPR